MAKKEIFTSKLPFEVDRLKPFFFDSDKIWSKVTGPKTAPLDEFLKSSEWTLIKESLEKELEGEVVVVGGNFFKTTKPYIIHTDGKHDHKLTEKILYNIVIPLELWPAEAKTKLIIFNQKFFGAPTKFVFGDNLSDFPVTTYPYQDDAKGVMELEEDYTLEDKDLNHLRKNWLKGLSIKKKIDWSPGSMIGFSAEYLHCSSCFSNSGLHEKLGLSIFLQRKDC